MRSSISLTQQEAIERSKIIDSTNIEYSVDLFITKKGYSGKYKAKFSLKKVRAYYSI